MISKFLDPKNDVAFRKIFGSEKNEAILIHFLNDILALSGRDAIDEVEFLSPIQDPEIVSKKQSIVDVLCKDKNNVKYIVEMQVKPVQGFEKRAQYYAAKAYSGQLDRGKKNQYKDLKAVIFIAISDCIIFPDKKEYKSDHVIFDKKTYERDLKDFSFTFIELPKFPKKKGDKLDNIIQKWCYFFKYAESTSEDELDRIIGSDLVIKSAYDELNRFNWSEEEKAAYDAVEKRDMDNEAADAAMKEAAEAKGKAKGKIEIATNMLKKSMDTATVSEITGLPIEEINKLKDELKNEPRKYNKP